MKFVKFGLLGAVAALAVVAPSQAASLIVNGDFEAPFGGFAPGLNYFPIGNNVSASVNAIPGNFGWSIPSGDIDIIPSNAYGAALPNSGLFRIDLNGFQSGVISQTFNTVAGRRYSLSLDYSANGGGQANIAVGTLSANITGNPSAAQSFAGTFTGTGAPQTLIISSLNGGTGGVVLDNIRVSAVPEAGTWAMLIAGFGMAGAAMRRRRAITA